MSREHNLFGGHMSPCLPAMAPTLTLENQKPHKNNKKKPPRPLPPLALKALALMQRRDRKRGHNDARIKPQAIPGV